MTPEQRAAIQKRAEEKYPGSGIYAIDQIIGTTFTDRDAYIAGVTEWCEKMLEIRREVERRMTSFQNMGYSNEFQAESNSGHFHEAREILSIIDKHLK